jgi:hypothetical protein
MQRSCCGKGCATNQGVNQNYKQAVHFYIKAVEPGIKNPITRSLFRSLDNRAFRNLSGPFIEWEKCFIAETFFRFVSSKN